MSNPVIVTLKKAIDPGRKKQAISVVINRLKSLSGVKMASHRSQNSHIEVEYGILKTSYSDIERTLSEHDVCRASQNTVNMVQVPRYHGAR